MKKITYLLYLIATLIPISVSAQKEVVEVPDFWETSREGTLNEAVQVAINEGTLSNTVFKLKLNGQYVLTDSIYVPTGEHLTIVAPEPGTTQETALPQILWSPASGIDRSYFISCYGDLTLKNIWLFSATIVGEQVGSCILFRENTLNNDHRCEFENVIIDFFPCPPTAGGSITVTSKKFNGFFRNCYWRNNADIHFTYYGRVVSFPFNSKGWYGDSIIFENCTFANIGYVLMQEGGEYYNYVKFNHCTFFDVVMFPLESGWWNKLSVTNCIFVNTHMYGDSHEFHQWSPYFESYGGTLRIDSLSKDYSYDSLSLYLFPFSEQDRRILFTNSSYYIEKWLRDWMWENPYSVSLRQNGEYEKIPAPQPMLSPGTLRFFDSTDIDGNKVFPYVNRAKLYDSTDPGFIHPPHDTALVKIWLYHKWYDSWDGPWAWKPENGINQLWPLEENLAYTNDTLKVTGMGGFPLGDLYHWWPEKYQEWKAQEKAENDTINKWLHYGFDPAVSVNEHPVITPLKFELDQNYPNPFNPTTTIRYELPNVGTRFIVSLKVYDLLGREVAILFEGVQKPGSYEVTFHGSKLSSGMYLYRLTAGSNVQTKKLVLMK